MLVSVLILLTLLGVSWGQACPSGCKCIKPEAHWYGPDLYHTACDNLNLPNVPTNIPTMTTMLSLSGNQISNFAQEISNLPNLKVLYLRQNNFRTIDAATLNALKGLKDLEAIDLSGNAWDCSCTDPMRELTLWLQQLKGPHPLDGHRWLAHINGYDATCSFPDKLKGKRIDELLASDIC